MKPAPGRDGGILALCRLLPFLLSVAAIAQTPSKEYIRLGGRVIAIENNAPPPAPALSIAETHSGSFMQGQQNATYTVTVSNGAGMGPTSGMVRVTEARPSRLTWH